ncbi:MAG: DUF5677 domain-containing protein [Alphaproteobacteria bacterium]
MAGSEKNRDDADAQNWIVQAEAIKTSGRWSDHNSRIVSYLNSGIDEKKLWWIEVISTLTYECFREYTALKLAFDTGAADDISLIAWRTRNLLEISMWAGYCAIDEANARVFYEDAGRDMLDIAQQYIKWGEEHFDDREMSLFRDGIDELKKGASKKGINDLDTTYTRVNDAAKMIGFEKNFKISYKSLSKFAHPTAGAVMLGGKCQQALQRARKSFYAQGCVCFIGGFTSLETTLLPLP